MNNNLSEKFMFSKITLISKGLNAHYVLAFFEYFVLQMSLKNCFICCKVRHLITNKTF